jgi:hypothetical protein
MNTHSIQISPISEFAIYGLYGDRDIVIPFPYPRKILVSENGWGKTTVLNTLYAVLTGRFFKLEQLSFDKIQVKFDNDSVSISKQDLDSTPPDELTEENKELTSRIAEKELKELLSLAGEYPLEQLKQLKAVQHIAESLKIASPLLAETLKVLADEAKDKYSPLIQQLRELFPIEVLYLTTYRRIEESLQNLGYSPTDLQLPSGLIQSGMDDVRSKIERIEGIAFEHQLSPETLLEEFTGVCNRYLIDKQLVSVCHTKTGAKITTWDLEVRTKKNRFLPLELLSSGEKHIISIFSYVYLRPPRRCAVLIDEPELSISVEWQRQLLPDLLKARHCCFLMAATHSPFIFDNDLATNTVDLQEYIREYE